ncbi:DsbC family protein [Marilutibacter chinensis]|uniref:Thiol:disulfide interchange protein n=1 Tax=Marilutibacter chinensis TaxID=2912247 RepID=A0ABS9HT67_9GAMM|nr:DsbC family protein [Lysobacter chinensis]MCF7222106.1 DsbC family protein [Lysobacter chinensis]
MKRTLLAVLGAISLSACAQAPDADAGTSAKAPVVASPMVPAAPEPAEGTPDALALKAVRTLSPNLQPEHIGAAPLPGFREVIVGGQIVYVSDDGRYMFLPGQGGALYDAVAERNLSEDSLAGLRRDLLKTIPASERIVFAPAEPKYTVTVFTDVECGYCRRLHSEIAEYNKQGIAIEYLAFPRMGIGSEDYNKMVSVWCASDRKQALTDAKAEKSVPERDCKNTVTMQYNIGQRAGLTGTPMILTEDGVQVGGYVPAEALRQTLDKLAASKAEAAPAPAANAAAAGGV